MKRFSVFCALLVFGLVIVAGSVSAINSCAQDSDIIFRISAETNAHGEFWNEAGNYQFEICASQKFDSAIPTSRTGSDILRLSSSTNAHGASFDFSQYASRVRYGDLICRTVGPGDDGCYYNESRIVFMSGETNAHFSLFQSEAYPYAVCCASPQPGVNPIAQCGNGNLEQPEEECDMNGNNGLACDSCKNDCTLNSYNPSTCSPVNQCPIAGQMKCTDGVCRDNCNACPAGQTRCNDNTCKLTCPVNACPAGQVMCADNICRTNCQFNQACSEGLMLCTDGLCKDNCTITPQPCTAPQVLCADNVCRLEANCNACPAGQTMCTDGICKANCGVIGPECTAPEVMCVDNVCRTDCTLDPCPAGQVRCADNVCRIESQCSSCVDSGLPAATCNVPLTCSSDNFCCNEVADGLCQTETCVDVDPDCNNCPAGTNLCDDGICKASCAVVVNIPNITRVYWTDFSNSEITNSFNGRTVKMVAQTVFYPVGTQFTFEIYEKDPVSNDAVRTISKGNALAGNSDTNGKVIVEWQINQSDMDASGGSENREFYFVITHIISGDTETSGILGVNPETGPNTDPIATISTPENLQIYMIGTNLNVSGECTDAEGGANPVWEIKGKLGTEKVDENKSFFYSPQTAGKKTITLRCVDDLGAEDEKRVSILATAGPGMIAYISEPSWNSVVQDDNRVVDFDASNSYVINNQLNFESCSGTVSCLSGKCPVKIAGLNSTWTTKCGLGQVNVVGSPAGFTNAVFSWNFSDGYSQEPQIGLFSGRHRFPEFSGRKNSASILLKLNYTSGGISLQDSDKTEFTLVGPDLCLRNGLNSFIVDIDSNGNEIGTYSVGGANGVSCNYLGSSCCPSGFSCNLASGACELQEKDSCGDYTTENVCESDALHLAKIDPLVDSLECGTTDSETGETIVCACDWTQSKSKCELKAYYEAGDGDDGGNVIDGCTMPNSPSCSFSSADCQPGDTIKRVQLEGEFSYNPGTCTGVSLEFINEKEAECVAGKTVEIDCRTRGVQLPFFGFTQIILAITAILVIYLINYRIIRKYQLRA